jgi:hypothetical protein
MGTFRHFKIKNLMTTTRTTNQNIIPIHMLISENMRQIGSVTRQCKDPRLMLARGQNEQDNFARPTKDRSEDDLEEKFQYETHSGSFCLTWRLSSRGLASIRASPKICLKPNVSFL